MVLKKITKRHIQNRAKNIEYETIKKYILPYYVH